ncbi:MAG: hypothetical protein H7318_03905 [Oligoflexus sp.]|nr:hypothetical protein [Oligoflexus sp.]
MKSILRFLFIGLLSSTAYSADTVATDTLACTRDYNAWGKAGRCACPTESSYKSRIGRCLTGTLEPVISTGEIATELAAIGGETSGIELQTGDNESYELVLPLLLKKQLEQANLKGLQYKVEGKQQSIKYLDEPVFCAYPCLVKCC